MNTALSRRFAASLALVAALVSPAALRAQDLPYSSGSTGTDGPLNVPTVFPNGGPRGGAVYNTAEGAAYYISSYYVWKTLNGATWTKVANLPKTDWDDGGYNSGQLCYDSTNEVIYALVYSVDYSSGNYGPKFYKLNTGNWEAVNNGFPTDDQNRDAWVHGRLVFHAANNTVVLFGVGPSCQQTWTFDGTVWTQQNPAASPPGRRNPQMAYDPVRNETLMFGGEGYADTWVWDGTTWTEMPFVITPPGMSNHGALWHPGYNGIAIPYTGRDLYVWNGTEWRMEHTSGAWSTESKAGFSSIYLPDSSEMLSITTNRTMTLKNNVWSFKAGNPYYIDMKTRPTGVFNYTDIMVPSGTTVKFLRNAANTPVIWLASGFVQIAGTVDVGGSGSEGGPGGYDGAAGLMVNGQGPGSGFPTDQMGGRYFGTYGNPQIEPLIGGSGGGRIDTSQESGGGGGGAILISATRDVQVTGNIVANGGNAGSYAGRIPNWWGGYFFTDWALYTGSGSGGAVKLVADRVFGVGSISANPGSACSGNYDGHGYYTPYPNRAGTVGRIRIEAYETDLVDNTSPLASSSTSPVWNNSSITGQLEYELNVTHVSGMEVRQPPTGQTGSPDVSFSTDQAVTVVVTGRNIPDGTEVKLMVSGNGINTTLPAASDPPVLMQSGGANFNVTIPAGLGNIQASAVFQKPAATP
jgi:hypothetical protein